MSHEATAWAYKLPLKGAVKPLLSALADYADEAGSCYPGQEKLALMTGLSTRTLRRAIDRAEQLGLLSRERRFDAFGHRTSDRYYLHLEVQSLPANVTTGHFDQWSKSTSLPANLSIPTGHSDQVSVRGTTRDPSGGREAPTPTPEPVENPKPLVPWCRRHAATEGSSDPCSACAVARERWQLAGVATSRSETWAPTRKPVKHIPGLCDAHRQPEATCEMCEREARDTITAQFGDLA